MVEQLQRALYPTLRTQRDSLPNPIPPPPLYGGALPAPTEGPGTGAYRPTLPALPAPDSSTVGALPNDVPRDDLGAGESISSDVMGDAEVVTASAVQVEDVQERREGVGGAREAEVAEVVSDPLPPAAPASCLLPEALGPLLVAAQKVARLSEQTFLQVYARSKQGSAWQGLGTPSTGRAEKTNKGNLLDTLTCASFLPSRETIWKEICRLWEWRRTP